MKNSGIVAAVVIVLLLGIYAMIHRSNKVVSPGVTSSATPVSVDSNQANQASPHQVVIQGMAFAPTTITVKKGDAVSWVNNDATPHTVTADQSSINAPASGSIGFNQTYVFTFSTPGTYIYHCQFHANMTGTVVVTE